MKILFSNSALAYGGAERVISILASKLAEKGHDVEVLLYFNRPVCFNFNKNVKIVNDESYIGVQNVYRHILWRRNYISKLRPDIVISFLAPFNMINVIAMLGLKIPLVLADRNDPRKVPTNFILRICRDVLYRFADAIVLQNKSNYNYFSRAIKEKSEIIYNPVNLGNLAGSAIKCINKEKKIVCVARVIKQKNPMLLLNAFYNISRDFPDYKLEYYGNGDMITEISEEARKKGLSDRIILHGAVDNVLERIRSAEMFVLTSDYEGMPNALLEAMCLGIPVISTRVSGANDLIQNYKNGLLVDCNDEEGLTRAMLLYLRNKSLRERCANEAVKLNSILDIESISDRWEVFISSIIMRNKVMKQ